MTALSALFTGCLDRELKPLNPCLVSGVAVEISVTNVDKVDVLFVVDDSQSMAEEQAALRAQFPKLVRTLAAGELMNPDGTVKTFPPVENLNLGVVSTDMGLPGVSGISSCSGLGDDGILQNTPSPDVTGCQSQYPKFLNFLAARGDNPDTVANDFQCIATLGIDGCGFEQQLESGLKALWPSVDIDPNTGMEWVDPNTGMVGNRITFLPDTNGNGRLGHGDRENANFLRNDPNLGLSLIAIVMVTDEEDCSSNTTAHFQPAMFLEDSSPYKTQPINLRCFLNKDTNLYSLDRYVNGFQALRPGNENLVVFAGIVGVPPDLVQLRDDAGNPLVNLQDDAMREQWYNNILNDPRMIETVDTSEPEEAKRNLIPSCGAGGTDSTSLAYPPRRIVEVAKRFGANGVVQSICQNDFSGAMDAIIEIISNQLGAVCLPRKLIPNSDGQVGCDVLWELPVPGSAPESTPTDCSQRGFLAAPEATLPQTGDNGGRLCVVRQLDVPNAVRASAKSGTATPADRDAAVNMVKGQGDGWFYDDFSNEVADNCPPSQLQRISFTDPAKPPTGVTVKLECLSELQSLPVDYPGLQVQNYFGANGRFDSSLVPIIGSGCSGGADQAERDGLCAVQVTAGSATDGGGGRDTRMFCHPLLQTCVRRCNQDTDCPPAWVCDDRGTTLETTGGQAICVNPTCGD